MSRYSRWLVVVVAWNALVVGAFLAIGARALFPYSEDMGFQIQMADKLFGASYRPYDTSNPPLFFLIVALLRLVIGDELWPAFVLVQLSAGLGGVALFFLLQDYVRASLAAMISAFYVVAPGIVQMSTWGGGPNLLGIALLLMAIRALLRVERGDAGKWSFATWAFLCAATHVPTAFLLGVGSVVVLLAAHGSRGAVGRAIGVAAAGGLLLLPVYLPVLTDVTGGFRSSGLTAWVEEGLRSVFREQVYLWALAFGFALWGYMVALRVRRTRALAACALALIAGLLALALTFWVSLPSRSAYYGYVLILAGVALALNALAERRPSFCGWSRSWQAIFIAALLLVPVTVTALSDKQDATQFYGWPDGGLAAVGAYLEASAAQGSILAPGEIAWRLGALSERFVYSANDPIWLQFEAERRDLMTANLLYWGEASHHLGNMFLHHIANETGHHVLLRSLTYGKWQDLLVLGPFAGEPAFSWSEAEASLTLAGIPNGTTHLHVLVPRAACEVDEAELSVVRPADRALPPLRLSVSVASGPSAVPVRCGTGDGTLLPSEDDVFLLTIKTDADGAGVEVPRNCAVAAFNPDAAPIAFAVIPSDQQWLRQRFDEPQWREVLDAGSLLLYERVEPAPLAPWEDCSEAVAGAQASQ